MKQKSVRNSADLEITEFEKAESGKLGKELDVGSVNAEHTDW